MPDQSPFISLLLITLLAAIVPVLVSRVHVIRLPIVVGEILAGIVIGGSGFDLVRPSPTLDFLAEFGFTFLMFLSGLEVNPAQLFAAPALTRPGPRWQRPLPLAALVFSGTVVLALLIGGGLALAGLVKNAVLMGLILSTTSLGIVVPVLKERRLGSGAYGQTLLATALISDFATLLLLSLTIAVISRGFSLDLLLFFLLLLAFVGAARIGQWASRVPFMTRISAELSHATAQIGVRGAFALMILWVVLADALGVEVILGAFLAGVVVSMSSRTHESPLREKLDAIGFGFFIPLFFIMVGAGFDLRALLESPSALLLVPLLIAAAYLVKVVPALLLRTLFTRRETLAAGALLSSRLSLIVAASAIALNLGVITSGTNAAVVLVAVITCTLSPIIFGRILPPVDEERRRGLIILGADHLARLLAVRLRVEGEPITLISPDEQALAEVGEAGFATVAGDPSDQAVLEQAGAAKARALLAVAADAALVARTCRIAVAQFGVPVLVARADEPARVRELQALGVRVVQAPVATALALEGALRFPAAFGMLLDKSDDVDLLDVPLTNPRLVGLPLRRVRLPGNTLILGIRRRGEVIVPHGDTVLQRADVLMVVGSPDDLREALRLGMEGGVG